MLKIVIGIPNYLYIIVVERAVAIVYRLDSVHCDCHKRTLSTAAYRKFELFQCSNILAIASFAPI